MHSKYWPAGLVIALVAITGCDSVRSISNSSFLEKKRAVPVEQFTYRGELDEFDVLGIRAKQTVTDADIQQALAKADAVRVGRGAPVLLIQSGAVFPDSAMVQELEKYVQVMPFSGVPNAAQQPQYCFLPNTAGGEQYSKLLRIAAAHAHARTVLCYWGILESETEDKATKTISWVPVMNWLLPDRLQHLRIRLKVALLDVETGNWSVFSPRAFHDDRDTTRLKRKVTDQQQVESLKERAYAAAAALFAERYLK